MDLHFLLPSLRAACTACFAAHACGSAEGSGRFWIAFDRQQRPHLHFTAEASHGPPPAHYQSLKALSLNPAEIVAKALPEGGSPEQIIERMVHLTLLNLAPLLASVAAPGSREQQLQAQLLQHALAGLCSGLATCGPLPAAAPAAGESLS